MTQSDGWETWVGSDDGSGSESGSTGPDRTGTSDSVASDDASSPSWFGAAATFFGALSRRDISIAAFVTMLVTLFTDPMQFVREYLMDALREFFVGSILQLAVTSAAKTWEGILGALQAVWLSVAIPTEATGSALAATLELALGPPQSFTEEMAMQLGLAAPIAALLAWTVSVLILAAILRVVYEVLATYLPLDAVVVGARELLGGYADLFYGGVLDTTARIGRVVTRSMHRIGSGVRSLVSNRGDT